MELISRSLIFFVLIYLWQAIYIQKGIIGNFTFPELMTYFLLTEIMRHLLEPKIFQEMRDTIRTGQIANYLLLPINSIWIFYYKSCARILVSLGFFMIPIIGFLVLLPYFVGPYSLIHLILALIMMIIGIIISVFIFILIGSISFWTVETSSIIWAFTFVINLFAGKLIPTQFFPTILGNILQCLPITAIYNLAPSIYLGKYNMEEIILFFVIQICRVLLLYELTKYIWKLGINRLELVGN